jgi:tetratricopeptide (TPR) repeat protein
MGEDELAILDFSRSIEFDSKVAAYSLNNRANSYRKLKQFEKAKMDIEKSLEMDEDNGWVYATLALIFADEGNDELFFKNIEIAISKPLAYPLKEKLEEEKSLGKYKNDERFLKILEESEG